MGNKSNQAKREKRLKAAGLEPETAHPRAKQWDRIRDLPASGQHRAVPKVSTWRGVVDPAESMRGADGKRMKLRRVA